MIKTLRVTMIIYALIGIIVGLASIFGPSQFYALFGIEELPGSTAAQALLTGFCFVSFGIFLIVAARDPIKHILWVKYAIAFALLMLVGELYSLNVGYVNLTEALAGIIVHAVFAVALLAFYPWSRARIGGKTPS
jgi:hypothetical protein